MNIPKALELASITVLQTHAELGTGVHLRPFQSLKAPGGWDPAKDREYPLVDVRATPPITDDNGATLASDLSWLCGTQADDDLDHGKLSALYESLQGLADKLYAQFRVGTDGVELALFKAEINRALASEATSFNFGGITFIEPMAPYDDDGANMIGIGLRIHYSRIDF